MTSNYNKVKNEGIHSEEFEEIIWDLDAYDKGKARTFLSTFADKVKEAVEEDMGIKNLGTFMGETVLGNNVAEKGLQWYAGNLKRTEEEKFELEIKTLTK